MADLSGKSAIVTGSSSGIGECVAILFAKRGCSVALTGRDNSRLKQVVQKCREAAKAAGHHDTKFITVAGDIVETSTRERLLSETLAAFLKLDILVVNHAIIAKGDSFATITEENFDMTFNVNLKSALFLIRSATNYLEATKGTIICVSTIGSKVSLRGGVLAYPLSKAAMDHMVRCLAVELGDKGIRINTILPTYVSGTKITRSFDDAGQFTEIVNDLFSKATPLKEQYAQSSAEDPAEAIAFLASDASRFISGATIPVDGGVLCRGNPLNFPPCNDSKL